MKCKTCAYWSLEDEDRDSEASIEFRKCSRILERWIIEDKIPQDIIMNNARWEANHPEHKTAEEKYSAATKEIFEKELAYTVDGSQYVADLFTMGEFGCVLHKPLDKP